MAVAKAEKEKAGRKVKAAIEKQHKTDKKVAAKRAEKWQKKQALKDAPPSIAVLKKRKLKAEATYRAAHLRNIKAHNAERIVKRAIKQISKYRRHLKFAQHMTHLAQLKMNQH